MICGCALAGTEACKNCNNKTNQNIEYVYTFPTTITYPIDPKVITITTTEKQKPDIQYWCHNCNAVLDKWQKFCHCCGQEIDWGDV